MSNPPSAPQSSRLRSASSGPSASASGSPPLTAPQISDAQLAYISDVLGLSSVILPQAAPTSESRQASSEIADGPSPRAEIQVQEVVFRTEGDLASSRLICLFHEADLWPLEGARAELALKMIQAMKMPEQDVYRIEWRGEVAPAELRDRLLSAGFRPVLLFGHRGSQSLVGGVMQLGEFFDLDGVRVMPTHSLSEMQAQPNLKKPTWSHMQAVMRVGL